MFENLSMDLLFLRSFMIQFELMKPWAYFSVAVISPSFWKLKSISQMPPRKAETEKCEYPDFKKLQKIVPLSKTL